MTFGYAYVSTGLGFTVLPLSTVEVLVPRESLSAVVLEQKVLESLYLAPKTARFLPSRYQAFIELTTGLMSG